MPFVQNMTITADPTGLSPTISWTLPTGAHPSIDTASITIDDNTNTIPVTNVNPFTNAGAVTPFLGSFQQANVIYTAPPIPGSTTSLTVPTTNNNMNNANFGAPVLRYGHTYSIGIILNNVTPGSTPVPGCPACTVDSRSVSYFDYTPINPTSIGLPAGTVIALPSTAPVPTTSGLFAPPAYHFNTIASSSSVTYIDPVVATGFDYKIGATDPNFRSVNPVTVVGNGIYSLLAWNGSMFVPEGTILAGQTFNFTQHGFASGVSEFEITGLDPNAGVSPTDITAFVTGLTFMTDGNFTGTMQAIAVNAVPEPSTWALMLLGFLGLGFAFRQSPRKVSFA
jgi:PEP-CTERM motif